MRLDKYALQKFGLRSRTYAENLVLTGRICVNGRTVEKPAYDVQEGDDVALIADEDYASQGAYKLEEALKVFKLDVDGLSCADFGAGGGGFTDVLLRNGAAHVLAIDVGECALPKRLLDSGKVTFVKANVRTVGEQMQKVDFLCADLSFISLKLVLGSMYAALKEGGIAVALVKPQFELDKKTLTKSGIVTDQKLRRQALDGVLKAAEGAGFCVKGTTVSPIRYTEKNVEYLALLQK